MNKRHYFYVPLFGIVRIVCRNSAHHGRSVWRNTDVPLGIPGSLALLADVKVPLAAVQGGVRRLAGFIERYQPLFYRTEQRHWAEVVLEGRLSNLERKTNEPIARQGWRGTQAGAKVRRRRQMVR